MELINKYFSVLSPRQIEQFSSLKALYEDWNSKINVISRKDTDNFCLHHVLHSLAIAKVIDFKDGSKILDIGTGGGFPGIPLAILFPNVEFLLVDSIGKKIKVVDGVVDSLGLKNVTTKVGRAESINQKFDFVVSRAVTAMDDFVPWTKGKFLTRSINNMPNGIFYLKGGDLQDELKKFKKAKIYNISEHFSEEFFDTKRVVYLRND